MRGTPSRSRIVMLLTNPATYDQRPLKEGHSLSRSGFDVTILAWDRDRETQSDSVYADGLKIKRFRLEAGHGTPQFTVPKLLVFYVWALIQLMASRADVVHSHDVDTLPVGLAGRVMGVHPPKLVYDMHDLPEAFLKFFPLVRWTQSIALAFGARWADMVLVVNDRFVSYLSKLGFERTKMVVVMNAPPAEGPVARKAEKGVFKVLYYGWLGESRGVKPLVEAVKGLQGVELTLAGRGELESWLEATAAKEPNIRFVGWLGMKDLEPLIRASDLIPSVYEAKSVNTKLSTPGKVFTAMSLSLPIVVPSNTFQSEIVERYGCGVAVDYNDPGALRKAIVELATDRELYQRLGSASHEAFLSSFSWEANAGRLRDGYERVLGVDVRVRA